MLQQYLMKDVELEQYIMWKFKRWFAKRFKERESCGSTQQLTMRSGC